MPFQSFLSETVFDTKFGSFGMALRLQGVDPDCRMAEDINLYSRRIERAEKVFREQFRIYDYIIKRSSPIIPYKTEYPSPESEAVCMRRVRGLQARASRLHEISLYRVVLFEPPSIKKYLGVSLQKSAHEYQERTARSISTLMNAVRSFAESVDDFLGVEILAEREATLFFRQLVNPDQLHAQNFYFEPGTDQLDYVVADTDVDTTGRDYLVVGDHYVSAATVKLTPVDPKPAVIATALLQVPCDFIACMEWHPQSTLAMRKLINSRRKTFGAQKISMLMTALHPMGAWAPSYEMKKQPDIDLHDTNLGDALVAIEQGYYFGDFSCTVLLLGTDLHQVRNGHAELIKVYGQSDASLVRETLNLWSAWRAILPGNTRCNHSYSYLINSDRANLAYIWQTYIGSKINRHINDEYLCLYETSDDQLYYHNGHVGGVFGVLKSGAPESGKSFSTNYEITHFQKYNPITLILDIGHSYRDITEQFCGEYYEISLRDQDAKMNPFSLPDTYQNRQFLFYFMRQLLPKDEHLSRDILDAEDRTIHASIDAIYGLDPEDRRLGNLSLPIALERRLGRWIGDGQYGHVFDNPVDTIGFERFQTFEFQGMEKSMDLVGLMCFYITHRFDSVVYDWSKADRLKLLVIDEGWRWMLHGDMGAYMVDKLKTGRKNNLCNLFVTQSALDSERAGLGELLNEACPMKMYFANPEIRPETYQTAYSMNPIQAQRIAQLKPREELAIYASDPARPAYKQFKVVRLRIDDADDRLRYSNDPRATQIKMRRLQTVSA